MNAEDAMPRVAVLVCGYNQRVYLPDCLRALKAQSYQAFSTYYIDNASTDGSVAFVEEGHPECRIMGLTENLGFATANNAGMGRAFAEGAAFCVLLNTDTEAAPDFLGELVATYRRLVSAGVRVGLVQATVLLHDQRDRVNTTGNALHYLGYGYCRDHLRLHDPALGDRRILSASGAAMLVPHAFFERVGGFDDEFFIYNEDQNLSWRGLLMGYDHYVSARSVIFHKYEYREHSFKMYHSEKNRLTMLLQNYSARTLIVLTPMLLLNEVMISLRAMLKGWFGAKLRSYGYVVKSRRTIIFKRRKILDTREVGDAAIFRRMDAGLDFEAHQGVLIRKLVSPLMKTYHRLAAKWV